MTRFQLDLTKEEIDLIDRYTKLARLRTKRDFVMNALTLFQWAAKEAIQGRTLCSVTPAGEIAKHLELPALSNIRELHEMFPPISREEEQKLRESASPRTLDQVLEEIGSDKSA